MKIWTDGRTTEGLREGCGVCFATVFSQPDISLVASVLVSSLSCTGDHVREIGTLVTAKRLITNWW